MKFLLSALFLVFFTYSCFADTFEFMLINGNTIEGTMVKVEEKGYTIEPILDGSLVGGTMFLTKNEVKEVIATKNVYGPNKVTPEQKKIWEQEAMERNNAYYKSVEEEIRLIRLHKYGFSISDLYSSLFFIDKRK